VIGTFLNVGGIVLGALAGLARRKPLPPATEAFFKVTLGAFTVFYGLRLTWLSLSGSLLQMLKQLLIAVLAMIIGRLAGHALGLQKISNRLGRAAREQMAAARPDDPWRASHGFKTCAVLFCAAPLGILGAVQDGLSGYFYPLAVKAVMDGLATMVFISLFGWGVMLSALPVLAIQGTITLACARWIGPFLGAHGLSVDSVNGASGLLVFSVALVILDLKKIQMADYLPSLIIAPLISWVWR
jgi:uncharacterized membrane protein YqgA involved in biofilm formation